MHHLASSTSRRTNERIQPAAQLIVSASALDIRLFTFSFFFVFTLF